MPRLSHDSPSRISLIEGFKQRLFFSYLSWALQVSNHCFQGICFSEQGIPLPGETLSSARIRRTGCLHLMLRLLAHSANSLVFRKERQKPQNCLLLWLKSLENVILLQTVTLFSSTLGGFGLHVAGRDLYTLLTPGICFAVGGIFEEWATSLQTSKHQCLQQRSGVRALGFQGMKRYKKLLKLRIWCSSETVSESNNALFCQQIRENICIFYFQKLTSTWYCACLQSCIN